MLDGIQVNAVWTWREREQQWVPGRWLTWGQQGAADHGERQEAFSVHLATHTGAFYKERPNQLAHIWCFSQSLQWCRHYRQEWECREEHNKRYLVYLLNWAGSSGSTAEKHQLHQANIPEHGRVGLVAEPAWAMGAWEHPVSMDRAPDGQRHFTHKNWWAVRRAAGRKDNMRSLICLQEREGGLKSKRNVRTLVFCSWCSRAAVDISLPTAKLTPPPPLSASQEHG